MRSKFGKHFFSDDFIYFCCFVSYYFCSGVDVWFQHTESSLQLSISTCGTRRNCLALLLGQDPGQSSLIEGLRLMDLCALQL
ncbi:hypothetical protein L6164_001360 [Bauhinia variegata]|uniref:Uncharacterized protein n=1 Tax=Bauhinia variegata TaxID=167791 RepID=A0ACB9QG31_BAUVA|nr:hypothetical protein L6164_001360 [Bauhinia variegata]